MFCATSNQLAPSLLTWILSPAASAPLLPETISVVSLVMKSPTVPVSVAMAVIASASAGPIVHHHLDDVAGRGVAGRVGHQRAELVVAIRKTALADRRRAKAAAVERDLISHRCPAFLTSQRQVEGVVRRHRRRVGRAAVGQASP